MRLINGDSAKQLKKLEDNSIDVLVTDPPYNLKFMSKIWDRKLPDIEIWKECLRVMKPGAFGFVMSAPRQDCLHEMIQDLETAGFLINFSSIIWSYASGFPKSSDLNKGALKRNEPDKAKVLSGSKAGMQLKPAVEVVLVVQKPLQEKSYIDQALKYAEEQLNKEQFIEEYDIRNIFQDKLLDCGENVEKTFPFLIVPKASKREKNMGCEKLPLKKVIGRDAGQDIRNVPQKQRPAELNNTHPTVKPVKLFTYLITLSTRPEDIVLDPFMGSGTTGIAAKMLNRQFVGIEMDKEYMKIAEARIEATEVMPQYLKNKFWE